MYTHLPFAMIYSTAYIYITIVVPFSIYYASLSIVAVIFGNIMLSNTDKKQRNIGTISTYNTNYKE